MRVAIWGAAGAIGRAVSGELTRRGLAQRVVGRSAAKLDAFAGAEKTVADVADPEGCARAAEGVDAIVYSLGLPYTKRAFAAYPVMMRLATEAAARAGVRRMIHISNVYGYGRPRTSPVTETHPLEPASVKGRYRKEQEDVVLEAHRGDLETLVLRLPDFYGPHADLSFGNELLKAAKKGGTANVLGDPDAPHQFVFTPDVGPIVCDLLATEGAGVYGTAYNHAGSGTISQRAFVEKAFRAAGHAPRLRAAGAGMVTFLGLFMPLMRELREMMYLVEQPVILDDAKLRAVLPAAPHTSYDAGIAATLASL